MKTKIEVGRRKPYYHPPVRGTTFLVDCGKGWSSSVAMME